MSLCPPAGSNFSLQRHLLTDGGICSHAHDIVGTVEWILLLTATIDGVRRVCACCSNVLSRRRLVLGAFATSSFQTHPILQAAERYLSFEYFLCYKTIQSSVPFVGHRPVSNLEVDAPWSRPGFPTSKSKTKK